MPEHEDRELTFWEPEQNALLLKHVEADRLVALYELAAYAGLSCAVCAGPTPTRTRPA